MRVVHVFFKVRAEERSAALEALVAGAAAVRAMPGCRTFLPFLDPTDAEAIGVMHEWETDADFAAYVASPIFVANAAVLRPLMTAPPVSRRFDATLAETVN